MKRHVGFYHKDTGLLHSTRVIVPTAQAVDLNTPPDHIAIDQPPVGFLDPLSQRVDVKTGQVVDYQPPPPSADHVWNPEVKRWRLKPEVAQARLSHRQAMAAIQRLESGQHRALRELALGDQLALDRLRAIESQIVGLRPQLIPGYVPDHMEEA